MDDHFWLVKKCTSNFDKAIWVSTQPKIKQKRPGDRKSRKACSEPPFFKAYVYEWVLSIGKIWLAKTPCIPLGFDHTHHLLPRKSLEVSPLIHHSKEKGWCGGPINGWKQMFDPTLVQFLIYMKDPLWKGIVSSQDEISLDRYHQRLLGTPLFDGFLDVFLFPLLFFACSAWHEWRWVLCVMTRFLHESGRHHGSSIAIYFAPSLQASCRCPDRKSVV